MKGFMTVLKIFERALGGMEAVLGEEISDLTADLLNKPLTSSTRATTD